MAATEEVSGHEIAGEDVNESAVYPVLSECEGIIGGEGYGGVKYAGFFYGGGAFCAANCAENPDEEIAGHEIAGMCVNIDAMYPVNNLPEQTEGCGNGYAGGQFAALMYGGGVPCNFTNPQGTTPNSNIMELCVLDYTCISTEDLF